MPPTLALAGDTMLGRGVAEVIDRSGIEPLFAPEIVDLTRSADAFVCNLECCISARGEPWPAPGKPFFFRAPPRAVEVLQHLGTTAVTLANNHALDFGYEALLDTCASLARAGIVVAGAGGHVGDARRPAMLDVGGMRLGLVAFTDHPAEFAAGEERPGVAHADLGGGVPEWLARTTRATSERSDQTLVMPHWGPNMVTDPAPAVRAVGPKLLSAGADLVAGHSAHVFHGVDGAILWDLGDFIDDYRVDARLRNDLSLVWLVEFDEKGPARLEAVPIALDYGHTRLAGAEERAFIRDRFVGACEAFGTRVEDLGERLGVSLR